MTITDAQSASGEDPSTAAPLDRWERRQLNDLLMRDRRYRLRDFHTRMEAAFQAVYDLQNEANVLVWAGIVDSSVRHALSVARAFAGRSRATSGPSEQPNK